MMRGAFGDDPESRALLGSTSRTWDSGLSLKYQQAMPDYPGSQPRRAYSRPLTVRAKHLRILAGSLAQPGCSNVVFEDTMGRAPFLVKLRGRLTMRACMQYGSTQCSTVGSTAEVEKLGHNAGKARLQKTELAHRHII
jgi:hypothetical protein